MKLVKIIGGENILSCLLNGQRINCFDGIYNRDQLKKWSEKGILLCPACGKPYEYCHGRVIQPYFRHKDKNQCEDKYSEPETEEHLQGKRDLYEWIKRQDNVTDVILEGWIPETKQRPDIMFKYNGNQCVIEYQCSPISSMYYERHELYQAAGIEDVWICGADKYFQCYHKGKGVKRLNELEDNTRKYYDPKTRLLFYIDSNLRCKYSVDLKGLYILNNLSKYNIYKANAFYIKDDSLNYISHTYYKSNRVGWVTDYTYIGNNSLAYCSKIDDFKLMKGCFKFE